MLEGTYNIQPTNNLEYQIHFCFFLIKYQMNSLLSLLSKNTPQKKSSDNNLIKSISEVFKKFTFGNLKATPRKVLATATLPLLPTKNGSVLMRSSRLSISTSILTHTCIFNNIMLLIVQND